MKAKLIDQNIFEELGLDNLSEEEKVNLLQNFQETVMQAVLLRIAVKLPKEKIDQLNKLVEKENEEGIGAFLQNNSDNLDALVDEESLRFKQALIARIQKVDDDLQKGAVQPATP